MRDRGELRRDADSERLALATLTALQGRSTHDAGPPEHSASGSSPGHGAGRHPRLHVMNRSEAAGFAEYFSHTPARWC
jgi:hypothetical protein